MNQEILFTEGYEWQVLDQRVHFTAQLAGALVDCYVSLHRLEHIADRPLLGEQEVLTAFEQSRFEIEEWAEQKILQQDFGEDGAIYL